MLTIQNLNFRIQDKALFQDASLTVPNGYRVGLVGPNGTGKSTLFKLITGELELDSGDIVIQSGAKVSYVRQDLPDDDTPIIDVVLASDTERANLLN